MIKKILPPMNTEDTDKRYDGWSGKYSHQAAFRNDRNNYKSHRCLSVFIGGSLKKVYYER